MSVDSSYAVPVTSHRIFLIYPFLIPSSAAAKDSPKALDLYGLLKEDDRAQVPPEMPALLDPEDTCYGIDEDGDFERFGRRQAEPIWKPDLAGLALSPDLHQAVRDFYEAAKVYSASDALLQILNSSRSSDGGIAFLLPEAAKRRLGLGPARSWMHAQVAACRMLDFPHTSRNVIFEIRVAGIWTESESGAFQMRISGEEASICYSVTRELSVGLLQEFAHGLGEMHRSGVQEKIYFVRKAQSRHELDQLRGRVSFDKLGKALARSVMDSKSKFDIENVVNRSYTMVGAQLPTEHSDSTSAVSYALSKRFTSDYHFKASAVGESQWEQFSNITASANMEGCSIVAAGTDDVYRDIVQRRTADVYLPIYLLALQELVVLTQAFGHRAQGHHDPIKARPAERVLETVTRFNMHCRFPIVSQLAHHSEFSRILRRQLGVKDLMRDLQNDMQAKVSADMLIETAESNRRRHRFRHLLAIFGSIGLALAIYHAGEIAIGLAFDSEIARSGIALYEDLAAQESRGAIDSKSVKSEALVALVERKHHFEALTAIIALIFGLLGGLLGLSEHRQDH